jgi:hypothetical protein
VQEQPGASCSLGDDGPPLDVSGRADGLYGVEGRSVGQGPLAVFERMRLQDTGSDPRSGKRWVHVHLSTEDAAALERFTSGPPPRGIAVVVDGRLASVHKVRSVLGSPELQVSCCDARACDRWQARLARDGGN